MGFSSAPLFLDPPNWQQPNPHLQGGANETLHLPLPPLLPPQPDGAATGGPAPASSTRPNSTAERARQAKILQPEGPLKCPRCDSTNTKFCYFNNYSLTQPRHFCKTCRRYWTSGGALRNVPVGGGCRRNRRRKSSRPKSPATAPKAAGLAAELGGGGYHRLLLPPASQLSSTTSFQNIPQVDVAGLGLNKFGGLRSSHVDIGENFSLGEFQQLPLLAGFEAGLPFNSSLYAFQSEGVGVETASYGGKGSQLAPVKMESVAPFIGGTSGCLWTDLAGISPSCTTSHIH